MIEVFYIAYLKNNKNWGLSAFNKFLSSYEKYQAGEDHILTILLRGYENNLEDYKKIKEICEKKNIKTIDTSDIGLDFGAYLDGAKQSKSKYICCLNTSSEIVCDFWLRKIFSPIRDDKKYKLIGNRGSWETCPIYTRDFRSFNRKNYSSSFEYYFEVLKSFLQKINFFRILYRFLFLKRDKNFPNYSIGTASFLIDRDIFLQYFENIDIPKTKMEAYKIENGENSISKYITKNGFEFCIVDKNGVKYDKEFFDKSGTYRSNRKNYIIKDLQQEMYEKADIFSKIYLKRICWGKF